MCIISDALTTTSILKRKRGGCQGIIGHILQEIVRRNGVTKMKIGFTVGARGPKNPLHAPKLSSEVRLHICSKMAIAKHWKEYTKDKVLTSVIRKAINNVSASFFRNKENITPASAFKGCTQLFY
jgi:hypothetical protein